MPKQKISVLGQSNFIIQFLTLWRGLVPCWILNCYSESSLPVHIKRVLSASIGDQHCFGRWRVVSAALPARWFEPGIYHYSKNVLGQKPLAKTTQSKSHRGQNPHETECPRYKRPSKTICPLWQNVICYKLLVSTRYKRTHKHSRNVTRHIKPNSRATRGFYLLHTLEILYWH